MSEIDQRAFLGRGWAFPVQPDTQGDVALVAHEEDIRQSIVIILGTSRGERVMRPTFGAGLRDLLFEPFSSTVMALARQQTLEALTIWEPRIDTIEVRVTADQPRGRLLIDIRYRVRATNTFYNLVYPFYLMEGERP